MVNAYEMIAPCFWDILDDVISNGHREYWLKRRTFIDEVKFYRNLYRFEYDAGCAERRAHSLCSHA